jgi:predicted ferric reductase
LIRDMPFGGWVLLLLWLLAAPAVVTMDYLLGLPGVDLWYGLSVAAGILTLFAMTGTLMLATRLPALQRHIPHDRAITVHRTLGTLVIVGSVVHGTSKGLAGFPPNVSAIAMIIAATSGAALAYRWMRTRAEARRWSYDRHKRVHAIAFGSLSGLLAFHLLEASFGQGLSAIGSTLVGLSVALPAIAALLARLRSVDATVSEVATTGTLTTITVSPNANYRYRGGQYAYLRIRGRSHPFSFLSSPGDPHLRFAARVVGPFTKQLADMAPGEHIRVSAPLGRFGYSGAWNRKRKPEATCLLGTGTGSVPILGLARDSEWRRKHPNTVAVVSVRNAEEIRALREIALLQGQMGEDLLVINRAADRSAIDSSLLAEITRSAPTWRFFLCASERIAQGLESDIKTIDAHVLGIHRERFSLASGAQQTTEVLA